MYKIECEITRKRYAINLVGQKIKMENTAAKLSEYIDKLIKQD